MKKLSLLSLLAFALLAMRYADDPVVSRLISQIQQYTYSYPQEKVYLHFDKPLYAVGETMWFKAYLTEAYTHTPDTLSKVLYVDLIDEQAGKLLYQKRLKVENGLSQGQFDLPDSLTAGSVKIRAYTNWMRNFEEGDFFEQSFSLYKGTDSPLYNEEILKQQTKVADFQVFPEGGSLVAGLACRVGFKAVNSTGKGIEVEGFILEDGRDTVAAFQSQHLGMGFFSITPQPGKNYKAHLLLADGSTQTYPLPKSLSNGLIMSVDNLSNKENIRVYVSHNLTPAAAGEPAPEMIILAQQRGQVCFAGKVSLAKRSVAVNIPRKKIPEEGVVQLTIFDAKGSPLTERLAYERKADGGLRIDLSTNKTLYKAREKVEVSLKVQDANGQPVVGDFSLAVTDGSQVAYNPHASNIHTYIMLTSDVHALSANGVKGIIEDPGYYFDSQNANAQAHLDLLLMTQGWRRFLWKEVLNSTTLKPTHFVESGLSITGSVLRPNGKLSDKPVSLTLFLSRGEDKQIWMNGTDADGLFGFYRLDFSDTTEVLVQAVKTTGGRNLNIRLDEWVSPKMRLTQVPFSTVEFDRQTLDNFLKRSKEMIEIERKIQLNKMQMLREVTIKGKKQEEVDSRRSMYGGMADNSIKVDRNMCAGATNVLQMLQGRVAGVSVTGTGFDMSVQIRGAANFGGAVEPLFLLDGMPVDKQTVTMLSPCDIETIDVLKGASAAVFGSQGYGGVISVLSRRGGNEIDDPNAYSPGVIRVKRVGYAVAREFYSPNYDDPKPEEKYRPDYRTTLYWNPRVRTDSTGRATITYWNSDAGTTDINLSLQGMSQSGQVAATHHRYRMQ